MKYNFLFFIFSFSLLFCLSCCSKKTVTSTNNNPSPTPVPVVTTYQLVWSDEFDKDGLPDNTKWGYDVGGNGWGNNELEYYTNARLENARVANGNLIIEARKESFGGKNYTSARLLTKNKVQWTYGKFDIRAKLPRGTGMWPAIWLLSANDPLHWPDDGELDIMEEVGFNQNVIVGTAHSKSYNGANGKGGNTLIPDADNAFHVYSIEWTNSQVKWAVDSVSYYTYADPGFGPNAWPYYKDFFMILNIAVGGNWGGQKGVDDTIFPQQMLIDYVRVYQKK
ncbi:MAG: glycoside hydrolase family 16 protein [Chitinophagaceae bacterium]